MLHTRCSKVGWLHLYARETNLRPSSSISRPERATRPVHTARPYERGCYGETTREVFKVLTTGAKMPGVHSTHGPRHGHTGVSSLLDSSTTLQRTGLPPNCAATNCRKAHNTKRPDLGGPLERAIDVARYRISGRR